MKSTIPTPTPSETCEQFCVRAHQALLPTIPDSGDRNQAVWGAWDMSRGSGITVERYRWQNKFAGWRMIPDVCHYTEHTTTTPSGPMKIGPGEIVAICANMNRRSKLGLVPPLINKHSTDDPARRKLISPSSSAIRLTTGSA